jgi:DHA1 family tetracycline resistance protein-like MFS transporter
MTTAPKPVSKNAIAFVLITVILDIIGFGIIIPVLPQLIETIGHISLAQAAIMAGWMAFAYAVAQFGCGPLMGNLSDRYGRRPLLLLAIAGLGLDYLLHALAPTLFWIFVGRILAGVCGASWTIANAFITDVAPIEERGKYFGMVGAAFGLGFILGPAIGGLLGEFGPRVPFYVAAAISGLNLIYGYFVLPETLAPENRRPFDLRRANPFGVFRVFATYKGVLPICAILFILFFATSIYPAIWPYWGIAKFGWSTTMVGLSLAVFGLSVALVQGGLAGPLERLFGPQRLVLIGLVVGIIAALGYGLASSTFVVMILVFVHAPEGLVNPMLTAILSKKVPDNAQGELQGGLAGMAAIATLGGTLFFTQVFGFFMAEGRSFQSPSIGYYFEAGLMALALVLFIRFVPDALRGKPTPKVDR